MNVFINILRIVFMIIKIFIYIVLSVILSLMGSKCVLRFESQGNRRAAKNNINRIKRTLDKNF